MIKRVYKYFYKCSKCSNEWSTIDTSGERLDCPKCGDPRWLPYKETFSHIWRGSK